MSTPIYQVALPNDHFAIVRRLAHQAATRTDDDPVGEELRAANKVLVAIMDAAEDLNGGMRFAMGAGSVVPLMNAAHAAGPATLRSVFASRNHAFAEALDENVITWARTAISGQGGDLTQFRLDAGKTPAEEAGYHA